jgi:hypothetical protein
MVGHEFLQALRNDLRLREYEDPSVAVRAEAERAAVLPWARRALARINVPDRSAGARAWPGHASEFRNLPSRVPGERSETRDPGAIRRTVSAASRRVALGPGSRSRVTACLIETLGRSLGRDTRVSFATHPLVPRASACARPGTQGPRDERHDNSRLVRAKLVEMEFSASGICGELSLSPFRERAGVRGVRIQ